MCPTSIHGFDSHLYLGDDRLLGFTFIFIWFVLLFVMFCSALSSSTFKRYILLTAFKYLTIDQSI